MTPIYGFIFITTISTGGQCISTTNYTLLQNIMLVGVVQPISPAVPDTTYYYFVREPRLKANMTYS